MRIKPRRDQGHIKAIGFVVGEIASLWVFDCHGRKMKAQFRMSCKKFKATVCGWTIPQLERIFKKNRNFK